MACVIQPFALILQKQIGHFLTYLCIRNYTAWLLMLRKDLSIKMSRMQWIVKEFLWCFYFRNQKNYGIMWRKKNHLLLCACAAFLDNKCFEGTNRLVFLQISSSSAVKKASHFKMGTKVMQACCVYFLADPVHLC